MLTVIQVRKGIYDDYPDYYDNVPKGTRTGILHRIHRLTTLLR